MSLLIKKTDKLVSTSPKIWMALSAIYGTNYQSKAGEALAALKKAFPLLKTKINVSPSFAIRLAPIKARGRHGVYYDSSKLAVIDCMYAPKDVMITLAHEMIHSEQYYEGRLRSAGIGAHSHQIWNGQHYSNRVSSYQAYINLPWEKEAFERSEALCMELGLI